MSQPKWKYVDNLGDASPVEHGGKFLFLDESGVYEPELEVLEEPTDDELDYNQPGNYKESARWTVYRVVLERLAFIDGEGDVPDFRLVPFSIKERIQKNKEIEAAGGVVPYIDRVPCPIESYVEWFDKDINSIAKTVGTGALTLRGAFCDEDPYVRAWAYECLASHWGWHELNHEPLKLTELEVYERYLADNDDGFDQSLIGEPPAHLLTIKVENSEDSPLDLIVSVRHDLTSRWAKHDQTIEGSCWECDGSDFAYAKLQWCPDMIENLKQQYRLDDDEYDPPTEHEIAIGSHMVTCEQCKQHCDFHKAKQHYEDKPKAIAKALCELDDRLEKWVGVEAMVEAISKVVWAEES